MQMKLAATNGTAEPSQKKTEGLRDAGLPAAEDPARDRRAESRDADEPAGEWRLLSHAALYVSGIAGGAMSRSPRTAATHAAALRRLASSVAERLGKAPEEVVLSDLDDDALEGFLSQMAGEGLSVATVNVHISALRSFHRYLRLTSPAKARACGSVGDLERRPEPPRAASQPLSCDAVGAILGAAEEGDLKHGALLRVAYDTAGRAGELCGLTVGSVLLRHSEEGWRGEVRLPAARLSRGRTVPVSPRTAELLSRYVSEARAGASADEPLFLGVGGKPITVSGLAYVIRKYAEKAGALHPGLIPPRVSASALRRSRAVHLYGQGVDLETVRYVMGTSSHPRAAGYYAARVLSDEDVKEALASLDDALDEWLKSQLRAADACRSLG